MEAVNRRNTRLAPTLTCVELEGCCSDGEPRNNRESVGWKAHIIPSRDRDARFAPTIVMRLAGAVLQRRGAEEKRRVGQSSEYSLGTDAHVRRSGGVL